jgi:hypothetical protein
VVSGVEDCVWVETLGGFRRSSWTETASFKEAEDYDSHKKENFHDGKAIVDYYACAGADVKQDSGRCGGNGDSDDSSSSGISLQL